MPIYFIQYPETKVYGFAKARSISELYYTIDEFCNPSGVLYKKVNFSYFDSQLDMGSDMFSLFDMLTKSMSDYYEGDQHAMEKDEDGYLDVNWDGRLTYASGEGPKGIRLPKRRKLEDCPVDEFEDEDDEFSVGDDGAEVLPEQTLDFLKFLLAEAKIRVNNLEQEVKEQKDKIERELFGDSSSSVIDLFGEGRTEK